MVHPLPEKSTIEDYYQNAFPFEYHLMEQRQFAAYKFIKRFIGDKPSTIFDIGTSNGFFLSLFKGQGWKCSGVEPNNVRAKLLDAIIRMPSFIRLRLARLLRIERFMIYRLKSFFRKYGPFIIGQRYYGKWFFKAAYEDNLKSHSPIAEIIAGKIKPSKVLDFGCGDGTLLHELKKRGVAGIGYEYSKYGIKLCHAKNVDVIKFDFSKKQFPSFENDVDMVISIEVAEHLPERIADFYCEVLSKCSDAKVLFFSAAVVGQTGEGHLNEQSLAYWKEKFVQNGWRKNEALTQEISEIMNNKGVSWYYCENLQIFQRS